MNLSRKLNRSVRICGDFKVTVNPHLNVDSYPLPTIDTMLATMAGGSKFTKIDLKTAYLQMEVEDDTRAPNELIFLYNL